jgi:quercetin dioxygenase-like cupin family protein
MYEQLWFGDSLVTVRAAHTDNQAISMIESLNPHGDSPPLHVHHTEDELFHVLEGELTLRVGEEDIRLAAGETAVAPKGVPHTYRVDSRDGARVLVVTTEGDFERMVRTVGRPAERSELPARSGPPTPEQMEALAAACRENAIDLVGPPLS